MDRRLAAILAADVVGYSRLMEADEAGTFERLKAHRAEVFEPEVKLHHGRIFKLMGDGVLAEFSSVVDAVECAVAVQKAMAKRNDGQAPDKRIDLRIGVNLGDVIIEGKDRHGEGVNIAARLQQLAPAGGICVSQTVIDHLSNKLPICAASSTMAAPPLEISAKQSGTCGKRCHSIRNLGRPPPSWRCCIGTSTLRAPRPWACHVSWDEIDAKMHEALEVAAKHPSPAYYQLTALFLVRERKSDEAVAGLQKAVALDPSDSWTFEAMAQMLIHNGRPKEALGYLDAAVRLDPAGLGAFANWRSVLYGFAAFGENRFEDAAGFLERIDLNSPEPWGKFYGLQVVLAAYGHLGRAGKAAEAMAKLKPVLAETDETGYSRLRAQRWFVFKHEADVQRLLDGLAKAGTPELPEGVDPHSKDRLTEAEIKSVYFGHELEGRETFPTAADYKEANSPDGASRMTIGSWSNEGARWTQAGAVCIALPRDHTSCGAVFRNPAGTFERKNQYLYVGARRRLKFSIVK